MHKDCRYSEQAFFKIGYKNMIGIILENTTKKSLYVFKTLFGIMGFEYYFISGKDAESYPVVVYYGNNFNLKPKYAIEIPVSDDFIKKIGKDPFTKSNGKAIFNIDLVSLSFFLLSVGGEYLVSVSLTH